MRQSTKGWNPSSKLLSNAKLYSTVIPRPVSQSKDIISDADFCYLVKVNKKTQDRFL